MSVIGQLRKAVNYEGKAPTCKICSHYKEAVVYLTTNSNTKRSHTTCGKFEFTVSPNGCCDYFLGKDGSVLDVAEGIEEKVIRIQQLLYR